MTDALLLPLSMVCDARGGGPDVPWALLGGVFALWWLVGGTCKPAKPRAGATAFKRCKGCQGEHPGFAAYCRHCGKKF